MVRARQLSRIYTLGNSTVIGVDEVHLDISEGQIVVLKGNSGSGKSTLLSLLAGLDKPSRGELTVAGCDLNHASAAELTRFRRQAVGMVFQSFNLLPTLTVMENVCLPGLLAGTPLGDAQRKGKELLEWLDLLDRRHHLPAQLSGGEMQRTAIARALINSPALILADEPTGNLDSRNGRMVIELLSEVNRKWGCTVMIATHSELADPIAGETLFLKDGRLLNRPCQG